jgi:2-dehydropantoate 2-reductase
MRIAAQGAGAMGLYLGGLLARAGEDVTIIARGAALEALRAHGLTVKSSRLGTFTVQVKTHDAAAVGPVEPVDLVLFCVKTYDTDAAAEGIRPLVGPNTAVLSVQNGVESAERIARAVGSEAVIGGVAQISAILEAPGVVIGRGEPAIIRFGELDGGLSERVARLEPVFTRAGIVAEPHTDIRRAIWEKFIFICALSGVTALTRLPLGPLLSRVETRWLLRGALDEVTAVARAQGVALADDIAGRLFDRIASFGADVRGSMAHDLANGRRLEVDALNGAAARMGQRLGVATPINAVIVAALAPYRDGPPATP